MITYKLEKPISLYKNQFDDFIYDLYGSHKLDRLSLDLDSILFRIKYICMNHLPDNEIPKLKESMIDKAIATREVFGRFLHEFLTQIIRFPTGIDESAIVDIMAEEVKIDSTHVSFKLILLSSNTQYLEYVDSAIPEDEVFNLFPGKYFRFFTDSYNDGIAKAYPELFENRQQTSVGTGKDKDVFTHSFTFQVTEACNLSCTYCFGPDTHVIMDGWTFKSIKDIKIGDKILGIPEDMTNENNEYYDPKNYRPYRVTNIFKHKASCIRVDWPDSDSEDYMFITPDHPILLSNGEYVPFIDWYHGLYRPHEPLNIDFHSIFNISQWDLDVNETPVEMEVYNLETECHTFVAWGMLVHNCYQFNKTPMSMNFDTAKTFIDKLLNDEYGYINRYNSPAIIIEFIGGEPFLEIKLIRQIYEYFLKRCYELNHQWFSLHRVSICSNGLLYFDEDVQSFFKDYSHNISFNISIDGSRELHDSCRVQPNKEGSYDIDMVALHHYNKHYSSDRNSKMTLAPANIKYLYESVVDFIEHGMTGINLNCVFEEGWNIETAKVEYQQLKKLADYILDNNLEFLYISIFNERQESFQDKSFDGNFCGGTGSMLALRPNGQFYPCIRYMPTSVGDNVKDLCIGDIHSGLVGRGSDSEILDMMDHITRRSQMNDICYECPIGSDCASCSALGHTVFGTPNKRCTFTCIQMIAEALANVYYWNMLRIKHPDYNIDIRYDNVPDEWALMIISEDELNMLKDLENK